MIWASLVAQVEKNVPAMQETPVRFLGREDHWRRDRLPTPVFLGFLGGSDGKESTCNVGDLGLNLGLEDPLEKGMTTHSSILAWRIHRVFGKASTVLLVILATVVFCLSQ